MIRLFTIPTMILMVTWPAAIHAQDSPPVQDPAVYFGEGLPPAPIARPATNAEWEPALHFQQPKVDFGIAEEGQEITISYDVVNRSDKTIKILRLNTGCGCTAAGKNPSQIAPGEETSLSVIFSTSGRRGHQARNMTLQTDEAGGGVYQLQYSGRIISPLYWEQQVVNLGEITAGESHETRVSLVSTLEEPLEIEEAIMSDTRVTAKLEKKEAVEVEGRKGTRFTFHVTIPGDYPVSTLSSRLSLRTNQSSKYIPPVSVTASVVGDVDVIPRRVFTRVTRDEVVTANARLHSRTGKPFQILEIKKDNMLPIEAEVQDGESPAEKTLVLTFRATAETRTRQGLVTAIVQPADSTEPLHLDIPITMVVQQAVASPRTNAPSAAQ